jgi:hypothetical protein
MDQRRPTADPRMLRRRKKAMIRGSRADRVTNPPLQESTAQGR